MTTRDTPARRAAPRPDLRSTGRSRGRRHWPLKIATLAVGLACSAAGQAIESGPFTLNGFVKVELQENTNNCRYCQYLPNEDKQRYWADELIPGAVYETRATHTTLVQPWFGMHFDLSRGFKIGALVSQRWRDGREDIPGYMYEQNIYLSHEDYGSLRYGAMTTRTWSIADYPYGTNVNLADEWGSSGAGYGLLKDALRYTSRTFDVAEGDLVLEATYAKGDRGFTIHKPRFWEFYGQYHRGPLVVDAMIQDSRNGWPSAWSHGPFWAPSVSAADDSKIGSSGQGIYMAMARYEINSQFQVSGGFRHNRWTGAYAVITNPGVTPIVGITAGVPAQWNPMFNVDWGGTLNGVTNPGYPARSNDEMIGIRYRQGKWVASAGLMHLGKAHTDNPMERGQSNTADIGAVGLHYDLGAGLEVYWYGGGVHYGRLGLSPMSMPGNSAFTNVDSRVTQNGLWTGVGAVFAF